MDKYPLRQFIDPADIEGPLDVEGIVIPRDKAPAIFGLGQGEALETGYAFVNRDVLPQRNVIAGGIDLVLPERIDDNVTAVYRLNDGAVGEDSIHGLHTTPVVPHDNTVTLTIEMQTVGIAKLFMRKYFVEFRHPCMRSGRTVHAVLPKNDFDGVCSLAADLQGSIIYEE